MFQVVKNTPSRDELIIYNVLQVNKDGNFISFLIEDNGKLSWMISSLFRPFIADTTSMPTFTPYDTRRSQVFYAAVSGRSGYTGYHLIYYDGTWKSVAAEDCIIDANKRLHWVR